MFSNSCEFHLLNIFPYYSLCFFQTPLLTPRSFPHVGNCNTLWSRFPVSNLLSSISPMYDSSPVYFFNTSSGYHTRFIMNSWSHLVFSVRSVQTLTMRLHDNTTYSLCCNDLVYLKKKIWHPSGLISKVSLGNYYESIQNHWLSSFC